MTSIESHIKTCYCMGATALSWLFCVRAELYESNFLLCEYYVECLYRLCVYSTDTASIAISYYIEWSKTNGHLVIIEDCNTTTVWYMSTNASNASKSLIKRDCNLQNSLWNGINMEISIFFTALHGMQTRSCDKNSVRLSVRLSVCPSYAWIVTKRQKDIFRFLYDTKDNL